MRKPLINKILFICQYIDESIIEEYKKHKER